MLGLGRARPPAQDSVKQESEGGEANLFRGLAQSFPAREPVLECSWGVPIRNEKRLCDGVVGRLWAVCGGPRTVASSVRFAGPTSRL